MSTDPLSDLLKTVRLTGAVFFDITAQERWAVASPPRDLILPKILPGADHLIAYHVVTAGQCVATVVGGQPVFLEAGQVVVFTNGQAHIMSSHPNMRAEPPMPDVLEIATAGKKPFCINYGDGPGATKLVCGYLACDARPFNPLVENLPAVITAGDPRNGGSSWTAQLIRFAVAEADGDQAGRESVLTRLGDVMFIEIIRRHLESLPAQRSGWLAGLRDPFVGKALSLMHGMPARHWTIEELAREVGLSRSVLAERFANLVGLPPMHYLTKWRMQIASELLTGSNTNMASIADRVGYESEASFSRAFKKMNGMPPSAWRQRER